MNIVTSTEELTALCDQLRQSPFVTVDTEFLRETTFWPKLCLVQLAAPDMAAVVDPLADGISLAPLFALLADEGVTKVFHAARQDIEIFHHLSGTIPVPLFDTQVAAMVCGFGDSIAYDSLVDRVTGAKIDKSSRFTNWAERPLSEAQLQYALADVTYLRDVYAHLMQVLDDKGRAEWMAEELAVLSSPDTYDLQPDDAWKRLKGRARQPIELAVVQALAALREREARGRNVPRNRIMKDDVIFEVASQRPVTPEALGRLRSVHKGFERSQLGQAVIAEVQAVKALPSDALPKLPPRKQSVDGASSAVELMKVLLKLTAEAHGVAPKVIATSDDLEAIVSGSETAALHGWRRTVFGEAALQLKNGEIAIAFDGRSLKTIDCERPVNAMPAPGRGRRRRRKRDGGGDAPTEQRDDPAPSVDVSE